MNTFFTSDLHFHHKNIIQFCNRPFGSVEHMNETLIQNWNTVVGEKDHIWMLGDFSFGSVSETENILKRLKGHKHLIVGNHDRKGKAEKLFNHDWYKYFVDRYDYLSIKLNDYKLVLCHFPFSSWERNHIHLHGHLHSTPDNYTPFYMRYDVGVDLNKYAPISLEDAVEKSLNVLKL